MILNVIYTSCQVYLDKYAKRFARQAYNVSTLNVVGACFVEVVTDKISRGIHNLANWKFLN